MANEQPIIVIKKKVAGHGHHGGAWKVAYADFVTAMMALFIVLWLLSSTSKKEQEEIGGYFRDPKGVATKHGSDKVDDVKENKPRKEDMTKLRLDLQKAVDKIDTLNKLKKQIEFTITDEGLRIELMENEKGTFFELGSSKATPALMQLLQVLSVQLGKLPNSISVEGHTDSHPYSAETTYGNWELSSDRANVARRLMQTSGIRPDQVSQVRGFADQRLRKPESPFDASNRRISLIVQYLPDHMKNGTVQDVAAMNKAVAAMPEAKDAAHEASAPEPASLKPASGTPSMPGAPAAAAQDAKPAAAKPASGLAALLNRIHPVKR